MSKQLTIRKRVPPNSALAKKEHLLLEAMTSWGESFYKMGVVLQSIYDDEDWKDGGYTNFNDYLTERQPHGINRDRARQLMAAAKVRPLLPVFGNGESTIGPLWNERTVRPLTHTDFTPSDVRRIGKKIATKVKNGERISGAMVKSLCDEERGVERKKKVRKYTKLKEASLENNLKIAIQYVQEMRVAFEMYDLDAWDEVGQANPQLVKSLTRELDLFASFMKG